MDFDINTSLEMRLEIRKAFVTRLMTLKKEYDGLPKSQSMLKAEIRHHYNRCWKVFIKFVDEAQLTLDSDFDAAFNPDLIDWPDVIKIGE